jgi:hypothetical protein
MPLRHYVRSKTPVVIYDEKSLNKYVMKIARNFFISSVSPLFLGHFFQNHVEILSMHKDTPKHTGKTTKWRG